MTSEYLLSFLPVNQLVVESVRRKTSLLSCKVKVTGSISTKSSQEMSQNLDHAETCCQNHRLPSWLVCFSIDAHRRHTWPGELAHAAALYIPTILICAMCFSEALVEEADIEARS